MNLLFFRLSGRFVNNDRDCEINKAEVARSRRKNTLFIPETGSEVFLSLAKIRSENGSESFNRNITARYRARLIYNKDTPLTVFSRAEICGDC